MLCVYLRLEMEDPAQVASVAFWRSLTSTDSVLAPSYTTHYSSDESYIKYVSKSL